MFNSYYNTKLQKACPISELISHFEKEGSQGINAACGKELEFTAEQWNSYSDKEKSDTLMNYRIAYLGNTMVNWCPKLGTVLANDEVSEGVSIRGGYPVEQKLMYQWCLRVSAYAQRLLDGLERIDWTDSLKETQRNWIGRSEGAEMRFPIAGSDVELEIFTTRADTVFGVTFMVLAPESIYVDMITTPEQRDAVNAYLDEVKHKTERERMIEKSVSGVFTGAYAVNPLTGKNIPVWVSDYVLAGYGTGAIMAVPAHDSRDYAFAKHFNLPIIPLIEGCDVSEESFDAKSGKMINSQSADLNLNGMEVKEAIAATKKFIEEKGIGKVKVNYRLRDAIFSRQRYWGEPFPVYYKDGIPHLLSEDKLPLLLPEVDKYLPTETGEPPLGRAKNWATEDGYQLELNTMPGFAGSSAYYLRYMDPRNNDALVSKDANEYWQDVDLYIGGTEHATGHLIYSRFWNKFLYDLGLVVKDEPFKKLINQGMIQGRSNFVYRIKDTNTFVSYGLKGEYDVTPIHVDVNIVSNDILDLDKFRAWRPEFNDAEFILDNGKYECGYAVEKMSKSMFNVVNPDDIVERYGADTLRLYEMFLGPLEQSKPWDTNGIDGVNRFLKRLWGLFYKGNEFLVTDGEPSKDELKSLHKLIKKVTWDIENFSFNTSIAAFMICVNELTTLKCHNREILSQLIVLLAPFAPHITEELWHSLGNDSTIFDASWPAFNEEYLKESTVTMAVSFNGKARFNIEVPVDMSREDIEKTALENEGSAKWLEGKTVRKIIVVPGKIVNIVVG
ncbi:MAG: leucine--tRNA ligase [Lachnospiraceae bacterium]|nr:leucine--tRNA ligase [Lachnospiraceae bacterium]